MSKFKISDDFVDHTKKDTAVYLFQQAEKCLIETLETDKLITDRCYRLLAILSPTTVAVGGYVISKFIEKKEIDFLIFTASITVTFLFVAIVNLYNTIAPKILMLNGSAPSKLITDETLHMVKGCADEKKQVAMFYLWETQNFEERIVVNRRWNDKRTRIFERSLRIIFWMTLTDVTFVVLYIAATLIFPTP